MAAGVEAGRMEVNKEGFVGHVWVQCGGCSCWHGYRWKRRRRRLGCGALGKKEFFQLPGL